MLCDAVRKPGVGHPALVLCDALRVGCTSKALTSAVLRAFLVQALRATLLAASLVTVQFSILVVGMFTKPVMAHLLKDDAASHNVYQFVAITPSGAYNGYQVPAEGEVSAAALVAAPRWSQPVPSARTANPYVFACP